jgi:putative DNA primase/helicase
MPRYTIKELEEVFPANVVAFPGAAQPKNTGSTDSLSGAPPAIMTQRRAQNVAAVAANQPSMTVAAQSGRRQDNSRSGIAYRIALKARQNGESFAQCCENIRTHPDTASWYSEKGILNNNRELWRAWERAGKSATTTAVASLPTIKVRDGIRHKLAEAGLLVMRGAGVQFYQRDIELVRVCMILAKTSDDQDILVPGIMRVSLPMIERALAKSAYWEKRSRNGEFRRINPPRDVAEQIAAMVGEWGFPTLKGIIGTPTLRRDGSVLEAEGYDPGTGLYLFSPPPMPPISTDPSKADAMAALALLDGLLTEFPFVDAASRAVALSMLMTPVLRGAFSVVPLHAVTAPGAGTGKSYLANIASVIATGERCAVKAASPNPEETEKRLMGAVLDGRLIVAIDNVNGELTGDFLCQLTEQELLEVRRLGKSDTIRVRNSFTVFANGNNLIVVGDQVRRTLVCHLDANMENPEARIFNADPIAMVLADRGQYVAAILTIARAYLAAGKPGRLPPLASYEGWSGLVRSALVWLGRADPVATMATAAAEDPIRQQRAAVFAAWAAELPLAPARFMTGEIIEMANEHDTAAYGKLPKPKRPLLRDALRDAAGGRDGFGIDAKRLGRWLTRNAGVVCGGHKLEVDRSDKARPRWLLSPV